MWAFVNRLWFHPEILLIIFYEQVGLRWNRVHFFPFQIRHMNILVVFSLRTVVEHVKSIRLQQILKSMTFCSFLWVSKSRIFFFVIFPKVLGELESASEDFVMTNVTFVALELSVTGYFPHLPFTLSPTSVFLCWNRSWYRNFFNVVVTKSQPAFVHLNSPDLLCVTTCAL